MEEVDGRTTNRRDLKDAARKILAKTCRWFAGVR
jgi:hypothetical protein